MNKTIPSKKTKEQLNIDRKIKENLSKFIKLWMKYKKENNNKIRFNDYVNDIVKKTYINIINN